VEHATGFVIFHRPREPSSPLPRPAASTEVKVFAFPLLKPMGKAGQGSVKSDKADQPVKPASFIPSKGLSGRRSLATGWLAGSLGGAKRIIVSQLADKVR